jgi:hypothetical protein
MVYGFPRGGSNREIEAVFHPNGCSLILANLGYSSTAGNR